MSIIRILFLASIFVIISVLVVVNKNYCWDCNVVLISIDTLRPDHLGNYGYKRDTSPNLDAFAKNASVFVNAYSTASWTLPAHASIFASNLPSALKVESIFDKIPSSIVTLPEILKKYGYQTYGFDSDSYVSPKWNFQQGFDDFVIENPDPITGRDGDSMFNHVLELFDQIKNKKFFLFVHTMEVHDPYCPPEEYAAEFKDKHIGTNCIDWRIINGFNNGSVKLSANDLNKFKDLYDGEIAYTDYFIGLLLKKISDLGLDKKTIIIITSDHGEEFGEHGTWGKHVSTLYNELIKIPLIIKAPNLKPSIIPQDFSIIDLAPSVLDLLGIKKPLAYTGESFRRQQKNKEIFFELGDTKMKKLQSEIKSEKYLPDILTSENKSFVPNRQKVGMIRAGWKIIRTLHPQRVELFDLKNDPSESNNLAFKNPAKTKEMEAYLIQKFNLGGYSNIEKINKNTNIDELNWMKSLGY